MISLPAMKFRRSCRAFVWLMLLVLLTGQPALRAAEQKPDGRSIYRQQCAKCHGSSGQGLKSKYTDAFVGDCSL